MTEVFSWLNVHRAHTALLILLACSVVAVTFGEMDVHKLGINLLIDPVASPALLSPIVGIAVCMGLIPPPGVNIDPPRARIARFVWGWVMTALGVVSLALPLAATVSVPTALAAARSSLLMVCLAAVPLLLGVRHLIWLLPVVYFLAVVLFGGAMVNDLGQYWSIAFPVKATATIDDLWIPLGLTLIMLVIYASLPFARLLRGTGG